VKNSNLPKANEEIKAGKVRLVDEHGVMIGIVNIAEALSLASRAGLDLVEISPTAEPPVCKILDFSKSKYDIKKRLQSVRKKQKISVLKEMKFKPNIGQGDFDTKLRKIKEFLSNNDKVKVSLWFKGREIMHHAIGVKLFERIINELGEYAKIESEAKMEGKQIVMMLSSNHIKK
jgi:translation initiation factor IF-3